MTSALNLISENCEHPFPPLCLILSIFSFPEDHLSCFLVTVSHPYLILAAGQCVLICRETGCPGPCQALCILTSHSLHSFLCFHLFLFTNSFWLLIHIPLWVDFTLEVFSMNLPLYHNDPRLVLCVYDVVGFRGFILK